jgi:hypothetical protein
MKPRAVFSASDLFPFLALCARAHGHPAQYARLAQYTLTPTAWNAMPAQAEAHGLAPLLYTHLQAASITMPPAVKQQLRVRTMQHAHANRVRFKMLAEILDAFQAAGIQVLVLKGAALAHLAYPHPGLRVMRDIDILVPKSEARYAQTLLATMGFNAPLTETFEHRHLPVAQRRRDGMLVSVEVHHNLYVKGGLAFEFAALRPSALPFTIEGVTAYTLGYEDMVVHIYRHMVEGAIFNPIRLIWIADLVSLSERCAAAINWARVHPAVRNALALCHWLMPLSETLLHAAAISVNGRRDNWGALLNWDFQGWPRASLAAQRDKGYLNILCDTFFPPAWWLRLYYGVGSGPALWWGRMVQHPLHILYWVRDYLSSRTSPR